MEKNKPKPLSELDLIDNFLFEELLNDPEHNRTNMAFV